MDNNPQSMIKIADSISSSFLKLKFVTVVCLLCTFATAAFCVYYSTSSISRLGDKVYLVDRSGDGFTASRVDRSVTRAAQIRKDSERMLGYFFNVSSNAEVVRKNVESALRLFQDRSLYEYYNDTQESGFYRRLNANRAVQEIVVDSMAVDTKHYPYQAVAYSTLYYTRASLLVRYSLVTSFCLIDVPANEDNVNGLMFEKFNVIENREVGRKERTASPTTVN